MSMSKSAQKASGDRARCDGPINDFVAFAKGLTIKSAATRLQKLAAGPDASRFAERLVQEAFDGSAHAVTCMSLIGRFGGDPGWRARLQAVEPVVPCHSRRMACRPRSLRQSANGLLVIARRRRFRGLPARTFA